MSDREHSRELCQLRPLTEPLLVSKRVAAGLLGVCVRTIDNLIFTKQLPCRRIGKRTLIPYSKLIAFASRDLRQETN
jgi:hypothetical protein